MRVLIAFGSKRGGTEGIARAVGEALTQAGHAVEVRPAHEPEGLQDWDAVVVGGALYAGRWPRRVRRFVQRHVDELEQMPVWFFSSGPLDESASKGDLAPTSQVRRLMARVHARGHVTFGGRLEAEAKGLIAQAMAKRGRAGDWRDLNAVKAWGHALALDLAAVAPRRVAIPAPHRCITRPIRRLLGAFCLFTGLTALGGGTELVGWQYGSPWNPALQVSLLGHSPFSDFLVPGLLLFWLVGVVNLFSGVLALRRHRVGEIASFGGGSALTVWILSQLAMLRAFSWLQVVYLVIGLATMGTALWLWLRRHAAVRSHLAATGLARQLEPSDGAARLAAAGTDEEPLLAGATGSTE